MLQSEAELEILIIPFNIRGIPWVPLYLLLREKAEDHTLIKSQPYVPGGLPDGGELC